MAIDRQALAKLQDMIGGEESDLVEIIASFLDEGPTLLAALQSSAQTSDLELMRRSAHSLKSNARDMGASELADICARIEDQAAQGVAASGTDVVRAADELALAIAELRKMYDFGGSA